MKLLQFFQYAYVVFAVLFVFDAFSKWESERNRAYISLFLAAVAIFMFFFRKRFRKKFEDRNKQ